MAGFRHKNIRIPNWDYSQSAMYMVTICINDRTHRLGEIDSENEMQLSLAGKMVVQELDALLERFPNCELDSSVIMPDHIHLLIGLGFDYRNVRNETLGRIVGAFKSRTTVRYIRGVKGGHLPPFHKRLWQVGYYETIMRNDRMAEECRYYIMTNPARWEDDLEMSFVSDTDVNGTD